MAGKTTYRVGVDIGGTFTDIVLLGSDGTIHTKKISSSVDNYARAIVEGLAEVLRETGIAAGAHRGDPPRHHGRLQRHPRAQGRQGRPDHHQGLPRRAGDPHAAHAAALRHHLDQAAAAGRALSARAWSTSASTPRATSSARSIRPMPSAPVDALLAEKVEAIAVCLHQLVRQSGARADDQGHRRSAWRPSLPVSHLLRGAARDQGVRAHLDDRHQRLCHADRRHLSRAPCARGSTRAGIPARAAADAVERRADHRHGGGRAAHEHHRVRARPAAWSARRRWRARRTSTRSSPSTWAAPPPRPRWSRTAR